jgi:hypothetical protein
MSKKEAKTEEVDDFEGVDETAETTEEVEEVVEEKPKKKAAKKAPAKAKGDVYTYIGGGADSPRKINFMGRQVFVRGKATEVKDPEVLKKVKNNPSFTQDKVDEEFLHDMDEKAAEAEAEQTAINKKIDDSFKKKHG